MNPIQQMTEWSLVVIIFILEGENVHEFHVETMSSSKTISTRANRSPVWQIRRYHFQECRIDGN